MSVEFFLEPKEVQIEDKKFIISKFPAIAGRRIVVRYGASAMPKKMGGDYVVNEEMMLELMKYVAVIDANGNKIRLETQALIDNHVVSKVASWEMLAKIEKEVFWYNCSFLKDGRISNFFEATVQKFHQLTSKISTNLSAALSTLVSQATKN